MTITVYTKDGCIQCTATFKALESKGIAFAKVDVSADAAARATVEGLGYKQLPVVVEDLGADKKPRHWSGFRPDEINRIAP